MSRFRLCLLLLLAVAMPVQAIAAVRPQLTHMDCHSGQTSDVPAPPACCGDACPDMTVCAAAHVVSAATVASVDVGPLMAPVDHYLFPLVFSRLSSPFRPPTILCV